MSGLPIWTNRHERESSTKGQYFDPRALCCSRHRVEDDVDAVAVGVVLACFGDSVLREP
jgi:hypothetical protein